MVGGGWVHLATERTHFSLYFGYYITCVRATQALVGLPPPRSRLVQFALQMQITVNFINWHDYIGSV